jgi:hypothetical protein
LALASAGVDAPTRGFDDNLLGKMDQLGSAGNSYRPPYCVLARIIISRLNRTVSDDRSPENWPKYTQISFAAISAQLIRFHMMH